MIHRIEDYAIRHFGFESRRTIAIFNLTKFFHRGK